MLLLLAAVPAVFWDATPATAPQLREAGIAHILVPATHLKAWQQTAGITAEAANLDGATKLSGPSVDYKPLRAGATNEPWVNSNGWRFLRSPHGRFYYDVPGPRAALAAAEAFTFGADAIIRTDAAGLKPLGAMLQFLNGLPPSDLPPASDIAFFDDGSAAAGEVMNLLVRGNLLFRAAAAGDHGDKITVRLGSPEYSAADLKNPFQVAHEVRTNLTDDRRSLRIYGSQVVLGRLYQSDKAARIVLLNCAAMERKVQGIRVRVLGSFARVADDASHEKLADFTTDNDATEFTLPELNSVSVIDLVR